MEKCQEWLRRISAILTPRIGWEEGLLAGSWQGSVWVAEGEFGVAGGADWGKKVNEAIGRITEDPFSVLLLVKSIKNIGDNREIRA